MADPTPEATLAYYNEIVRPALVGFMIGLEQATKDIDRWPREGAAVAVVAAITFVKNMKWDLRYWAPLEEALEMVERGIKPESIPYYKRAAAIVSNLDAFRNKPLPALEDLKEDKFVSRKDTNRIVASVAVDYQLRCKRSLPEALKKVVGRNPVEAKKLEDFREALRRKKVGAKREMYDVVTREFKDSPPALAAQQSLTLYQIQVGKKQKP